MVVLDDIISALNHDSPVKEIRQGLFLTAVVSRFCGLASTLPRDALRQESPVVRESGVLLEKQMQEITKLVYSERILEAAIGMAAINSLLEININATVTLNAADLIIENGRAKNVAIVGHFPFVPKLREITKSLWVLEKNPQPGDFKETRAASFLPQADVVVAAGMGPTTVSGLSRLVSRLMRQSR